ncbi:MAG: C40 family peptidase, partial [Eggerthellaceae bacterium]|nr:C40 family peptidase [Eggerthellaceae bacterium]
LLQHQAIKSGYGLKFMARSGKHNDKASRIDERVYAMSGSYAEAGLDIDEEDFENLRDTRQSAYVDVSSRMAHVPSSSGRMSLPYVDSPFEDEADIFAYRGRSKEESFMSKRLKAIKTEAENSPKPVNPFTTNEMRMVDPYKTGRLKAVHSHSDQSQEMPKVKNPTVKNPRVKVSEMRFNFLKAAGFFVGSVFALVLVVVFSVAVVGVAGIHTTLARASVASSDVLIAMGLLNPMSVDDDYYQTGELTMIREDSAELLSSIRHEYPAIQEEQLARMGFIVPSSLAQKTWKEIEYSSPSEKALRESRQAEEAALASALASAASMSLSNLHWGNVKMQIEELMGTPYVWGGKNLRGWDCSGFVSYVLRYIYKTDCFAGLGTNAIAAYCSDSWVFTGTSAEEYDEAFDEGIIRPGDIVMVYSRKNATGSVHVGIAGDDKLFYHAWNESFGTGCVSFDYVWRLDNAYTGTKSRAYASFKVFRGLR